MTGAHEDFRTTRWTMVLRAADTGDGGHGRAALEELCGVYWYPLYALARRRGLDAASAEDAVQGFFTDLLAREDVGRADPERGRFRAFLSVAFRNFLANERERERALKRGGGQRILPIDADGAEARYAAASGRALDPSALFDRAWALALLDNALARLRADYAGRGQAERFEALSGFITAHSSPPDRADLAARLGLSEGALKVAIHRLRERYREALLATVRDTVDEEDDVEVELGALFAALS